MRTSKVLVIMLLNFGMLACTTVNEDVDTMRASELNAQLGIRYLVQGKDELALSKLQKALYYNDENVNALHYMAELYRRVKRPEKAEQYYKKALKLGGGNDTALLNNYGVFLCDHSRYREADEYFQKVLNDPVYANKDQAYENIGLCALKRGELRETEDYLLRAIKYNPKLPKALLTLAQIKFDSGQVGKSYSYYSMYVKIAHQTPQSLWLGILLERKRGNGGKAASYGLLLKAKFPDSDEKRLLDKLETKKSR